MPKFCPSVEIGVERVCEREEDEEEEEEEEVVEVELVRSVILTSRRQERFAGA